MLQVQNLTVKFLSDKDQNEVVKDISFTLKKNKILGIVGESGSGKSVTSLAVLGLLPKNTIQEGTIFFDEKNFLFYSNSNCCFLLKRPNTLYANHIS